MSDPRQHGAPDADRRAGGNSSQPYLPKRHEWFRPWADRGYRLELRRSGHYHVRSPEGRYVVTVAATPSDHRALANARAAVRRYDRRGGAA